MVKSGSLFRIRFILSSTSSIVAPLKNFNLTSRFSILGTSSLILEIVQSSETAIRSFRSMIVSALFLSLLLTKLTADWLNSLLGSVISFSTCFSRWFLGCIKFTKFFFHISCGWFDKDSLKCTNYNLSCRW